MKKILFVLFLLPVFAYSQKAYFQQRVDYKISVKIYPKQKSFTAFESLVYKNNSPDTLKFIYFHLWPNGYQKNSALARQQAQNGKPYVQFNKKYRGFIDSLDFKVDGQKARWTYYKNFKDIAILYLPKPLAPGQSVTITTPFYVKMPYVSSRMGYTDKMLSITQWYPKPAVYDRYGWHAFPYLDQGEFYSEYGSFDVKITVPSQYVVAATGNMLDSIEAKWQKMLTDKPGYQVPYPTGKAWKTVHFYQDSIHDFAIFVSDQYRVHQSSVRLPHSGRIVHTKAYFYTSGDWEVATNYVDSAIYYYSLWVGDYPYNVASAVEGGLVAGSGMEYPTITVISMENNLEQVVVHEVGHNWFYGVLGFNERRYPFLDEGINSYYDHRYGRMHASSITVQNRTLSDWVSMFYPVAVAYGFNQPLDLTSTDYSKTFYGVDIYEETAKAFRYLEKYLGTAQFDRIMKKFYKEWKFKHPYPDDLKQVFLHNANKPVAWFFNDLIHTNKLEDFKVKTTSQGVVVKNTGQYTAPVDVQIGGKTKWLYLAPGEKKTVLDKKQPAKIDSLLLTFDWYPYNNYTQGKIFNKPLKIRFLTPKFFDLQHNTITFTPLVYWQEFDKWMPGLAIHNFNLPIHKFNFALIGYYSFAQKLPHSAVYLNYKIPLSNGRPAISFNVYADNFQMKNFTTPRKFFAKVTFDILNKTASDKYWKTLDIAYYQLHSPDWLGYYFNDYQVASALRQVYYLGFNVYKRWTNYHPFKAKLYAYAGSITMAGLQVDYTPLYYTSLQTFLKTRLFIGWQAPLSAMNPATDVTFSGSLPFHYIPNGIWHKVVNEGYGNFILNTGFDSFSTNLKNKFVVAANVVSTPMFKGMSFLRGFTDIGYVSGNDLMWEAGLNLSFSGIDIYFPLVASTNLAAYNPGFKPFRTFAIMFHPFDLREILAKF